MHFKSRPVDRGVNGTRKERREKLGRRCLGRSVLILVHCTRLYAGKDGVSTNTWRENQVRAGKDISINPREIVESTKESSGEARKSSEACARSKTR